VGSVRARHLAWCLVSLLLVSRSIGAGAQAQRRDLKRLAKDLHLTPAGVPDWLKTLGVDPLGPAVERLLAVTVAGEIVSTRDGIAQHVMFGTELDLKLLNPVSDLVLIHNHPHSLGFSADDLVQLQKPGVTAVVAVGHDGSVYIAARGPRYDRDMFEPVQYAGARKAVTLGVTEALAAHTLTNERVDAHFAHVISLALARAGVIDYYTDLAAERRSQFETARAAFGQLVAFAASRVR
jgi:hypothetical protein